MAASLRLLARASPYVESELLGLGHVVRRGDVCLDVGSAAGIYSTVLAHLVGPGGAVHSVEPLPFAHPLLRAAMLGNEGTVRRHTLALGAHPGPAVVKVPLRRAAAVTGRAFLASAAAGLGSNREFGAHVAVTVRTETLDGLCSALRLDRLDFVKIDVEGAELLVLEGGRESLARWRPGLLLEIEARHAARYGYLPDDLVRWLSRYGYQMRVWGDGIWRRTDRVRDHTRNYLFVPTG